MKKSEPKPQTEKERIAAWREQRAKRGELQKPKGKKVEK